MFILYSQLIPLIVVIALLAAAIVVLSVLLYKRSKGGKTKIVPAGIAVNIDDFREMFEPVWSVSIGKADKQEETLEAWCEAVAASENDESGYKAEFEKRFGGYRSWGVKVKTKKGEEKIKVKEKKRNKRYRKAAKKLVKYFKQAGVIRGHDIFVTGDETTAEKYVLVGDGSIEAEKKYEVLAPFWCLEEKVVDKGVIR